MGYFSNGTEGHMYEERYCDRCVHGQGRYSDNPTDCPVLLVHSLYNYDQHKNEELKDALSALIPVSEDGLHNEQCAMFLPIPVRRTRRPRRLPLLEPRP